MTSRFAQPPPTRPLEMGLAFVFGCVFLAAVLWLAFRAETVSEQQFEILRIVLALAGGGVGAVIPGFLDVNVKASTKLALCAGGALAVFVVLYFWSPAHWEPPSTAATTVCAQQGVAVGGNVSGSTITNTATGSSSSGPCVAPKDAK
jgi:peptidoglycan/LPS O-acetylase OafA/YrhL